MEALALTQPRRSRPTAIHALPLPLPPGLAAPKHWIKFWGAKWRSSPRVRATTYAQHGLWLAVVSFAMETEAVLRITDDQLADALGVGRADRRKRFTKDLARLVECGLLIRQQDGHLFVPRLEELQGKPKQ